MYRSFEIVPATLFQFVPSHFFAYTLIAGYTNILKITHTVQLVIGSREQYLCVILSGSGKCGSGLIRSPSETA